MMHNQILLLTSYITLLSIVLPASIAAPNFDRKYRAHHHSRLVNRLNAAASNAATSGNCLDNMGAANEGNGTVDITIHNDRSQELVKRDGTKYVFMHHIVGNTYPYTLQDWKDDIIAIQAKGVDALALNIGAADWERSQVSSAYAAALGLGTGFKLFISFDFTDMACTISDVVSRVNEHAAHPNQFRINGKPMISSYSGDCFGDIGWASIKSQTNGYLMPFIWGLEGNFGNWPSLDSWYCWGCAWPQGNYDKNVDDDNYYLSQLGNKYATTVSGWFYTHYSYKNEVLRSDDWLINSRWEQLIAMRNQLTFVEMVTWNDYGESDYFGPVKGAEPEGTTWAANFPHTAWFEMSQYYITAFKTGVYPAITQDVIYYWARPHPAAATASSDNIGRPTGTTWTQDYLWAAVFATGSCSVTLTSGSQSQVFTLQAGVSKIKMPLYAGGIKVSMVKGGQTIISQSPTEFTFVTNPQSYNYNAYVGSASATGGAIPSSSSFTVSTTSSASNTLSAAATPTPRGWTYVGCYKDPNAQRVLTGFHNSLTTQTVANCLATCQGDGFAFAGTEFGKECWCGANMTPGSSPVSAGDCSMPCAGKSTDICGGGNRISIYHLTASSGSTTATAPTTATPSASATSTSPGWTYVGCYKDPNAQRVLTGFHNSLTTQSVASCLATCRGDGFAYAGTEFGKECWCGTSITSGSSLVSAGDCSMPCAGKSTDICGGGNRISLYKAS